MDTYKAGQGSLARLTAWVALLAAVALGAAELYSWIQNPRTDQPLLEGGAAEIDVEVLLERSEGTVTPREAAQGIVELRGHLAVGVGDGAAIDELGARRLGAVIIKRLVGKDKLDRKEEDVIDIVGMLFEAMLNLLNGRRAQSAPEGPAEPRGGCAVLDERCAASLLSRKPWNDRLPGSDIDSHCAIESEGRARAAERGARRRRDGLRGLRDALWGAPADARGTRACALFGSGRDTREHEGAGRGRASDRGAA